MCKPEIAYTGAANVDVVDNDIAFDPNSISGSCPDQIPALALSIAEIADLLNDLKAEISTKKDDLFAKVDNGNTELLLSNIQTVRPNNYFDLAGQIVLLNGYISDEVAIAFMQNSLRRPLAKTIALIANSPLPENTKGEIDNMNFNHRFKNFLLSVQDGENAREQDEKEIRNLEQEKYRLLRIAEYKAYKDTTGEKYSEVVDLLLEQDEWNQKEKAYYMLKNSPRKDEAPSVFLQLQEDLINFDEQKRYHMEDYLDMLAFKNEIDTLNDSLRVVKISARQNLLVNIMSSSFKKGRIEAEQLLEEADLDPKEPLLIQLPNPEEGNRSAQTQETPKAKTFDFASAQDLIEVYPNPVDDILTVEYLMFNGMSASTIGIYDINGKLLMTQNISQAMDILDINVSHLSAGTYIIAFGKDGACSNSTKFIVK